MWRRILQCAAAPGAPAEGETEAPSSVSERGTTSCSLSSNLKWNLEVIGSAAKLLTVMLTGVDGCVSARPRRVEGTADLGVINTLTMKGRTDSLLFTHHPVFNFLHRDLFSTHSFCFPPTAAETTDGKSQTAMTDCFFFLFPASFNPPVIFSTGRPCASTAWRTSSGPSRGTFCTRRGLSTSGRSSPARCPTLDLER